MMNRIGRERGWPPAGPAQYAALAAPDGALALGSPDEVAERIGAWKAAGADTAYLQILDMQDLDHVRLIGREVAPRLA